MPRLLIGLYVIAAITVFLVVFSGTLVNWFSPQVTEVIETIPTITSTPIPSPTLIPIETLRNKSVINTDVPFTVQAPLGEWSDPKQQDACEEAALLMAVAWARNETLGTPQETRDKIIDIANYQTENYGDSRDTSTKDSLDRIAKGYFNFNGASYKENISTNDIIRELHNGNLVITPMNGQAMNNPHFTSPGPERHMVLIIGYDSDTNEFITNDAGVAPGKDYRYPVDLFFNAVRDYETGYHLPIEDTKKNMIVIQK